MQCKDIPTEPILHYLAGLQGKWTCWYAQSDIAAGAETVRRAMPDVSDKLALAKMRMLHRAGLVGGCPCGCRGDFEITDKGLARIGVARTTRYNGY